MTQTRGLRGATTIDADTTHDILTATQELLEVMAELNGFSPDDLASIFFTVTPDVTATFPARAARQLGWSQVPMMCGREMTSPGGLQRCIRVLVHWNTDKTPSEVRHVYLRGARHLRPDWAGELAPGADEATLPRTAVVADAPPEPALPPAVGDVAPVAFQGEPGAYSQEAIYRFLGADTPSVPSPTFADAFDAVAQGRAQAALMPVENSTTGSIYPVYDLMLAHDLTVQAEVIFRVRHVLMAPAGTALADVREVWSHPQALEQCARWIASHGWSPQPVHDTAGAARQLADAPRPGVAAIASEVAAARYGLTVLARDIQDVAANYTRFVLLTPRPLPALAPTKTSILFATRHVAGDLYSVLAQFAVREINLTRIASRPDRKTPWNYIFYLDLEGPAASPRVQEALAAIGPHVTFLRVLGSFPSFTLE